MRNLFKIFTKLMGWVWSKRTFCGNSNLKFGKIKMVILVFKIAILVLHDGLDLVGMCKNEGVNFK